MWRCVFASSRITVDLRHFSNKFCPKRTRTRVVCAPTQHTTPQKAHAKEFLLEKCYLQAAVCSLTNTQRPKTCIPQNFFQEADANAGFRVRGSRPNGRQAGVAHAELTNRMPGRRCVREGLSEVVPIEP